MQTNQKINRSFWELDLTHSKYDYIIIGGGLVGSTAALSLRSKHPDASICIIDKHSVPTGASSRNAGFACFGSVTELLDDLTRQTEAQTKELIAYRWNGLKRLRSLLGDDILDYQEHGGVEVLKLNDKDYNQSCFEKIDYLNALIYDAIGISKTFDIKDETYGFAQVASKTIVNNFEGQIHPGKMMRGIYAKHNEEDIHLMLGRNIADIEERVDQVKIKLSDGTQLYGSQVIIATNAFTKDLLPELDLTPGRNQVMMTKPIPNLKWQGCFHYNKGYVYFRNFEKRILIGGGRNIDPAENTSEFGFSPKIQSYLLSIMREIVLPETSFEVDRWWSGIIAFSDIKNPIIQKHSPRINLGVRLGGMGVAIGSMVGEKLANLADS